MRDANKPFESGLLASNDMSMYQDMFDKQITLALSERGVGFAKCIEDQIDRQTNTSTQLPNELPTANTISTKINEKVSLDLPSENKITAVATKADQVSPPFKTPNEFVTTLWSGAKQAAQLIGVHPALLLAQAALETDWGKKIITHFPGKTSHNLFNIKSDSEWKKESVRTATLEQKDGVLVKEQAQFRSYSSYEDSFMDYAHLITNSTRYDVARKHAEEPKAYTQALQNAGYASDEKYASKIMEVYNSPRFQALVHDLK
jgi:flagellar protein FlgJ